MVDVNRIGLQFFAGGGTAGGSTPDGGEGGNGSGLSGDFAADMQRYFGVTPRSDAGNATKADAPNGETEQEAADEGSATGEAADAEAASSGQQKTPYSQIREDYKDDIHADFQRSFNERYRQFKETETNLRNELKAYRETTAALYDRYGLTEDAAPQELLEKIKADNAIFSKQAMAHGVSTETYRDGFFQKQAEKAAEEQKQTEEQQQAAAQEDQRKQQFMQTTLNRWRSEEEDLKKSFPGFDLRQQLNENKRFRTLLEGGASVAEAFYGANFEAISSGLVAAASQQAAKRAAQTVAANRARPSEGGQNAGTGIRDGRVDVNSLTDKQVLDILQQVAKGARITF